MKKDNLKGQEGESPSEDPNTLIKELEELTVATSTLIQKINKTNHNTLLETDLTLADAFAKCDGLIKLSKKLNEFAQEAGSRSNRYSKCLRIV